MRAETGPMQFEDDWTGVFIRGDNALMLYAPALRRLLKLKQELLENNQIEDKDVFDEFTLKSLLELLSSANHHAENESLQMLKDFKECKK